MGKVTYSPGIQYVKGSLSKPKKVDGHSHGDYLIGTHREAATTNPNCTRIYIRKADTYQRSTPVTDNEQQARSRFQSVAAAVRARAKNLSTLTSDQEAFEAQKGLANGKKTFKAYLWMVCGDAYDQQHG
jgi:hypothetical protein